jgi:uncharacterized membrane protein
MPLRPTALPLLLLLVLGAPLISAGDASAAATATATGEAANGGFWPWMLFGRLHVITVHFPIALLTIVLMVESLRFVRKRTTPDPTLTLITVIAALSAVAATVMGWAQAGSMDFAGNELALVTVHRWLGVVTAVLAVVVAALALSLQLLHRPGLRAAYLASLVIAVLGVSVTGHYGGLLVHGEDYFTSALPSWMRGGKAKPVYSGPTKDKPGAPVDFAHEIEPLFKNVCYECHDEDKQKGDLRMDRRADLLKGGASGAGVVPGDPGQSLIIQRVLGEGEDAGKPKPRMPKKHDPLTPEQIELLERWVAQGANYAPVGAVK